MPIHSETWNAVSSLLQTAYGEIGWKLTVTSEGIESEEQFREFLEHNEFELAWDELAELGAPHGRSSFWLLLARAAEEMELPEKAAEASRRAILAA